MERGRPHNSMLSEHSPSTLAANSLLLYFTLFKHNMRMVLEAEMAMIKILLS